jgi:hypothetical protein
MYSNSRTAEHIFMKLYIGDNYSNLSTCSRFLSNWTEVTDTLHEDLFAFISYVQYIFSLCLMVYKIITEKRVNVVTLCLHFLISYTCWV